MKSVILFREYRDDCTLGTVVLPSGKVIKSIERPWLNNRSNISCYPEGIYLAKWLERSGSGKYKRVWHIQDVPNRTGILWHVGNLVRHSLGCTLAGLKHGKLGSEVAVLSSGAGINAMRREMEGEDFMLVVTSHPKEPISENT
jgi:hypothetical protein